VTTGTVVLGAGPAGAAAAASAAQRGESVWLAGRVRDHPAGTLEVLSGRANAALLALGWYADVVSRARPCDAIVSRWASAQYVELPALLEPGGLGWIVDRAWFDPLVRRLAVRDGVRRIVAPAQVPAAWRRVLATGKHARFGGFRRALGPSRVALTAVCSSGEVRDLAYRLAVEAVPDGWWSAVDDGRSVAVTYVTDPALLRRSGSPEDVWRAALRGSPGWLPVSCASARPRVRPIRSRLQAGDGGAVRVGDSALSVDPLSGHGLALALESGLRCHEPDYLAWLVDQAGDHARTGRAAHAAVPFDTAFWQAGPSRPGRSHVRIGAI
jgi:2-polyprenyl-6-methoxyphenol hydroxylase-like FAD-dependent oxidoreductase